MEQKEIIIDVVKTVKDYTQGKDWRVKENANIGSMVFQGLNSHLAGRQLKRYALAEMYGKKDPNISRLHGNGSIHLHDLGFPLVAYCCGHSLQELILKGFGEVAERMQCSPPKHFDAIITHMINYIGTMQAEFSGAQAFSSVDTLLAPFVRLDNLTQQEVDQHIQMLIFGLNVPSRWGWQTHFSNLTFDLAVPDDLKNKKILQEITPGLIEKRLSKERRIMKEKYRDFFPEEKIEEYTELRKKKLYEVMESTYGEYQKEMDMINKAFLKNMIKGDKLGRIFTFPIPTYNLTKDFEWDSEVSKLLFEAAGKYGLPYFQNYIGSDLDPKSIRAMCCRLNLDQNELINRPGGMWGPGDSTGSIGVVTINMNRIGYEAGDEEEFLRVLGERMEVASHALEIKRKEIVELLDKGFVPYTKSYLKHLSNHFSTIGLCGMNEACVNLFGKDISSPGGKEFTVRVLEFMRKKIKEYQNETGNLYNLEATPAESTAYRFAKKDKELYPEIFTSGKDVPFLTNSTNLPVDAEVDLFEAIRHQEPIQTLYNGGTIFHTYLGERVDGETAKKIVRTIAERTKLPYFTITPVFSVCQDHGYISGKKERCPNCKKTTEVYDRIVGYLRPTRTWNVGKQEEFKHRRRFNA